MLLWLGAVKFQLDDVTGEDMRRRCVCGIITERCGDPRTFFGVANGGLAHYNCTDIQLIYPTKSMISDVSVCQRDVFVITRSTSNDITIVVRVVLSY